MTRPSWQKKKRPGHRMPREVKRGPAPRQDHRHIMLWLWSVNGEKVATYDASGSITDAPAFCLHEGVRYEKVERQGGNARVVHYQTKHVVLRDARSVA